MIRPIYHRLQRRIEAHITINFAAYTVYKELERQLKNKNTTISAEQTIEIAKSIYAVQIKNPHLGTTSTKIVIINDEQTYLANLFKF